MSANQEQLNVVGFLSSFVTLVSLSHFSFVSTCVYPGERRRVARPPLALARGARGGPSRREGSFPLFSGVFSSAEIFFSSVVFNTLYLALARGFLCAARGEHPRCGSRFWARSLESLQGVGGTIVVPSDVGSFLLLGPWILTAGRDGQGHLRGQSCPPNSGSSSEDVRCSDRDRDGHDSGNSVVPSSTPGPQADRGLTAGRKRSESFGFASGIFGYRSSFFCVGGWVSTLIRVNRPTNRESHVSICEVDCLQ
jgi:hypothetical protein